MLAVWAVLIFDWKPICIPLRTIILVNNVHRKRRFFLSKRIWNILSLYQRSQPKKIKTREIANVTLFDPKKVVQSRLNLKDSSNMIFYYMEESVLLGTKPLVDSIRHFIRDPSGVFYVCHLCDCRIIQWRHESCLLLLLNWFLHIIKRTLHVGSKIWILCSRGKNNISRVSAANEWDIVLATRT